MSNEITIDDVLKSSKKEDHQKLSTATKRAGRPRQTAEKATNRVTLYLTDSQLEAVENHCHKTKQKIGTYIKDLFFEAFEKKRSRSDLDRFLSALSEEEIGRLVIDYLRGVGGEEKEVEK